MCGMALIKDTVLKGGANYKEFAKSIILIVKACSKRHATAVPNLNVFDL